MQASRGRKKYKNENLFINVLFVKLELERHILILATFKNKESCAVQERVAPFKNPCLNVARGVNATLPYLRNKFSI